ncbi:hypothetical protein GMAR_ORF232 [Golden Marseillevirus]|uniref:hypothetical protein n=1 Tax=Golden Marseillevirus TaxID=1720526 RepID=UPI000877AC9C|nr:hypothetical protein GMAR_ORF232 [Golden Marseillevirus]ALX27606.1 hypothetical protein GMAR_ORF232 [Golden Marseillevirus]
MVNTFLPHADFAKSAKSLDSRRLNKQIIEAYQILTILEDLWYLSIHFNDPPPVLDKSTKKKLCKSFVLRCEWIKSFSKFYRKQEEKLTRDYVIILKGKDIASGKKGLQINLGFCCHPATKMWFGYERALRKYINACISELGNRTTKDGSSWNLPKQKIRVQRTVEIPWWCGLYEFHQSHKAALLRKEPMSYQEFADMDDKEKEMLYFWPGDFDAEQLYKKF